MTGLITYYIKEMSHLVYKIKRNKLLFILSVRNLFNGIYNTIMIIIYHSEGFNYYIYQI